MAANLANVVRKKADAFKNALARARYLCKALARCGYTKLDKKTKECNAAPAKLLVSDQRDVAQFVFFEIAVLFETLVRDFFEIEVRIRFEIAPRYASHVMGSSDQGTERVSGWGDPSLIMKRARKLGLNTFHHDLTRHVGKNHYDALIAAHRLRNRIAHGPGVKGYDQVMGWARVPERSRRGCGPGRLLLDYGTGGRAFELLMSAYEQYAKTAEKKLQ